MKPVRGNSRSLACEMFFSNAGSPGYLTEGNASCGTEMSSRQGYNPLQHASQRAGNFESQGQAISGYPWLLSSSETCLSGPRRGQSHPFLPVSASLPTPYRGAITNASVSFCCSSSIRGTCTSPSGCWPQESLPVGHGHSQCCCTVADITMASFKAQQASLSMLPVLAGQS